MFEEHNSAMPEAMRNEPSPFCCWLAVHGGHRRQHLTTRELNAIAAKMKARNIAVDKVQRLGKHLIEMSINGETVYTHPGRRHHAVWPKPCSSIRTTARPT